MTFPDGGQLIVKFHGELVQTLPLDRPVLTIGRLPDNGLRLDDGTVSRHHAELRLEPDGPMLIDLRSANGTFVDGVRLQDHQPHLLADGSAVRIGPFVLTYQAPVKPATPRSDVVTPAPTPERPEPTPSRPTYPMAPLAAPLSGYMRDLPIVFQDSEFLERYLRIFESIWEPLEQRQDYIAMYFDPRTCPASFLPWLAGWLDVALQPQWPEPRVRDVLMEVMELYRWEGTRYGMERLIEVCTGLTARITEDPADPFILRVRLAVPPQHGVDRDLIEALIQAHKPAHAGYIVEWPQ